MKSKMAWHLFILAISCLLLASCSSGTKETGSKSNPDANDTVLQFYSETVYPLPGGYDIVGIARLDNCLMLAGSGERGTVLGLVDYTLDDAGRVELLEARPVTLENPDATVYGVAAGGDGYFHVLTGAQEGGDQVGTDFSLICCSKEGVLQESVPISCDPDTDISGVQVGNDGEIVLHGQMKDENGYASFVSLFSGKGELIHTEVLAERFILSSARCSEGIVFSGVNTSGEGFYTLLDSQTGKLTSLRISGTENIGSQSSCQGLEGEYIIDTGERYLEYDLETGENRELLRWYGVVSAPLAACRLGEYAVACCGGGDAVYLLGMETAGSRERSVVNVALIGVDESVLHRMNQSSTLYEYRASGSYSDYDDSKFGVDRFLAEMITGKAPDLVLIGGGNSINTDSGLFDDLYSYMDADEMLSRDSFIPGLLQALACGSELHQIWEAAEIYTLAARAADVGSGAGLTPADYNRIVDQNERYCAVFDRFVGKQLLLGWISNVGCSAFVDRKNASCDFDSQKFRDLLAWCKDMGDDVPEGSGAAPYDVSEVVLMLEPIQNLSFEVDGKRYLCRMEWLTGEPCVFAGFPNGDRGFSYFTNGGVAMAIPVKSQNKEGAWAFIRERLSVEHQMEKDAHGNYFCGLPVIGAVMRHRAEEELSEEDAAKLYALMESIQDAETFSSQSLHAIIQETGEAYLSGDKTLDEAVALIQSRASLWVAEQYG